MTIHQSRTGRALCIPDPVASDGWEGQGPSTLIRESNPLTSRPGPLRVALIAGTLVQDGAEKQLVYMARALRAADVDVRIYCLTRGEFYERVLTALGMQPHWVGRFGNRFLRLLAVTAAMRRFRPHIVQAAHFFTNLYTTGSARLCNAVAIGCSRCDVFCEVADCQRWGAWSLHLPPALLVNSEAAKRNAASLQVNPAIVHVLANVIDVVDFDTHTELEAASGMDPHPVAIAIGRLAVQKRFDLFLAALAQARRAVPNLKGALVGDGPERPALEQSAAALGLLPDHLAFLGRRRDVPALLRRADMLVLSSGYEGFPNVVLEAMAARLPVITTPAGDSPMVVEDGITGYVVPFDGVRRMAECMVRLAESSNLRRQLGEAGRKRVELHYAPDGLAVRLLSIYENVARQQANHRVRSILAGHMKSRATMASETGFTQEKDSSDTRPANGCVDKRSRQLRESSNAGLRE